MKKLVSLLLALMLVVALVPTMAEEAPEGYPEKVADIDFGGATLYISPYWDQPGRVENPDEDQQATYDWQDWIQETYNVKIVYEQKGSWGESQVEEIQNFISKGDASELRIFIMPPGFVGSPLANGWFADWANNELLDFSDTKLWNTGDVEFMTKGSQIFGVATGNPEPRQCVYFNKRVLEDAGIDWNTIYDMQKDGTWNWENFEALVAQVNKDTDSDGVTDIYGLTGNFTDFLMASVFNNGGCFFDFDENGKLVVKAGSDNVIEAETWATKIWNDYARAEDSAAGDPWNYFVDVFKSGNCGFCVHQTYGGYNEGTTDFSDMQDDWGCVAIPKGPKGDDYYYLISDNITVVPSIYDAKTTRDMQYIYSLYYSTAPGVDDEDAWIQSKYEICSDTRAVDETYAMLRQPEHGKANKASYLGTDNLVLGSDTYGNYLWGMRWSTPAALYEGILPAWEGLCAVFNGDMTQDEFNTWYEEKKAADAAAAAAAAEEAAAEGTGEEAAAEMVELYKSDFTVAADGDKIDGWYGNNCTIAAADDGALLCSGRTAAWQAPNHGFALKGNTTYKVSVEVKQDALDAVNFKISAVQDSGNWISTDLAEVKKGEWTTIEGTLTTGDFHDFALYIETEDNADNATIDYQIRNFVLYGPEA